jgi:hypothetical protein
MTTDLNIKVDMGRVQSSVQAAIRPAVEEALTAYDIKGAILRQLTAPRPKKEGRGLDLWSARYLMFGYHAEGAPDIGTLLDGMVREGIQALAKEYVEQNIRMQRGEIEEAFRKMMNGSTNRLVKAFAAAVEDALKEDWGFNLKVEVEHTTARSDDD